MPMSPTCCRAFLLSLSLGLGTAVLGGAAHARGPEKSNDRSANRSAEVQEAKAHFAQGKAFYDQGNLQLARAEFEESYRLSRRPDLLFNLALVSEKLGAYRESADYLLEYLRQRPDAPDRKVIQRSIDELERRAEQQRQREIAQPPPPPPPPEATPVPLARPVLVPVPPDRDRDRDRAGARRPLPWGGIGLMIAGAAHVAIGAGLGGAAASTARSVELRFDPALDQKGRQLEAAGIALDVIGAAALGAGAIWTIVALGRREQPRLSLVPAGAGASLSGSF